jgi:hypothetical protein
MPADESSTENPSPPVATGLLYSLTAAFPSWAGAILTAYSIFLRRFDILKIRREV